MAVGDSNFSIRSLVIPVFLPSLLFTSAETALIPIIPASAQSLGASIPLAGAISGLLMVGTLLADIPAARIVARFGERKSMIFAALVGLIGVLVSYFAHNLIVLGLGIALVGSGAAVFGLARHGYLAGAAPLSHRARSLSLLGGTFRAGAVIGPVIGSWAISLFGTQSVYVLSFILCAIAAVTVFSAKTIEDSFTDQQSDKSAFQVAKEEFKSLSTVGVGAMILAALRATRFIGLPLWALHIGLSPSLTALYIGLASALDFALFYTSGQIMDRFGRRWVAIPTLLGMGATHLLFGLATDASLFLTVALLLSLANGIGSGLVMVIGADYAPPQYRNQYLASYRLLIDTGSAAAPQLLAFLAATSSLAIGLGFFGLLGFVGAGIMWRHLPKRAAADEQID
jgi:MFS family permease